LLTVDSEVLNSGISPFPVQVEMQDSVKVTPEDVAPTIELLNRAGAISLREKVQMAHSDWEKEEVEEEVKRIESETTVPDPDFMPFNGGGGGNDGQGGGSDGSGGKVGDGSDNGAAK
jgi:hypothetical protein